MYSMILATQAYIVRSAEHRTFEQSGAHAYDINTSVCHALLSWDDFNAAVYTIHSCTPLTFEQFWAHARSSTTQQLTHAHQSCITCRFQIRRCSYRDAPKKGDIMNQCWFSASTSAQHWPNIGSTSSVLGRGGGVFVRWSPMGKSWLIRPVRGALACGAKRQYLLILQVSKYCLWLCRPALSVYIRRHVRQLLSYLRHAINTTTCGAGCKWIFTRIIWALWWISVVETKKYYDFQQWYFFALTKPH